MEKIKTQQAGIAAAREFRDPGFEFTRRTIALACIFAIVVVPLMAGVFNPFLPISYGYEESTSGFMFFTSPSDVISWVTGTGVVLGPIHWHLVYAIAGMYFGSSSVK